MKNIVKLKAVPVVLMTHYNSDTVMHCNKQDLYVDSDNIVYIEGSSYTNKDGKTFDTCLVHLKDSNGRPLHVFHSTKEAARLIWRTK